MRRWENPKPKPPQRSCAPSTLTSAPKRTAPASSLPMPSVSPPVATSSLTAATTSPRATSATTPPSCWVFLTSMAASSAGKVRPASSRRPSAARAIAASFRNRRSPARFPPAWKAACSASCQDSSASSRPPKLSNSSPAPASRSPDACCMWTHAPCSSANSVSAAIPRAPCAVKTRPLPRRLTFPSPAPSARKSPQPNSAPSSPHRTPASASLMCASRGSTRCPPGRTPRTPFPGTRWSRA